MNRRELLLSALAAGYARPLWAAQPAPKATADAVIVLWMGGGMAHTETFDPKRYTPYEAGTPSEKILSTFPAIPTVVDGLQISQGLEKVAQGMDRATLIRTYREPVTPGILSPDVGRVKLRRAQSNAGQHGTVAQALLLM